MPTLEKELMQEDDEGEEENMMNDSLFIKFKSSKKITEELQNFIEENLGMCELIENGDDKIFIFELKINDIDFESIQ